MASLCWAVLFPLVNLSSGELKPRSTFVSENAVLQHAPPAFHANDVSFLACICRSGVSWHVDRSVTVRVRHPHHHFHLRFELLQTKYAQRSHRRFALETDGSAAHATEWIAAACRRAYLEVEVQPIIPAPQATRHEELSNVVCWVPSRGPSAGYEYMLISTSIDAAAVQGQAAAPRAAAAAPAADTVGAAPAQDGVDLTAASTKLMPHEAFIALALGRRLVATAAGDTGWLAKDAVFLFTVYASNSNGDGSGNERSNDSQRRHPSAVNASSLLLGSASEHDLQADAVAHIGVSAFLRAHDYDPAVEQRSHELQNSRSGSSGSMAGALRYLSALLAVQSPADVTSQPVSTISSVAGSVKPTDRHSAYDINLVQPLTTHHGALRVALHLRSLRFGSRPAAVPSHVGISLAGPDGRMPELDLFTLSVSSLALSFRVLPGGEHALLQTRARAPAPCSRAPAPHGAAALAEDRDARAPSNSRSTSSGSAGFSSCGVVDLVEAADSALAHAGAAAMTAVSTRDADVWLHNNIMRPIALPLLNALHGRPMLPTGGDVAEYVSRLTTAVRFAWRALWGPFAPSALLVRSGYPALSLTFGRHADFYPHAAESKASKRSGARSAKSSEHAPLPAQLSDCRVLNPCDYKQLIAGSVEALSSAPAAGTGFRVPDTDSGPGAAGASVAAERVTALGAGLERVLRAMSGTDERLHASLYGYIPLGPTLFVGMHEYLAAAAPAHVPMLLSLIAAAPGRDAVVRELLLATLLLCVAAFKGALLLVARSEARGSELTLQQAELACTAVDALCTFALLPLLRRCLSGVRWCDRPVPALEDAALVDRISLKKRAAQGSGHSATHASAAASAAAAVAGTGKRCLCRRRTAAGATQQRSRRRIRCGGPLLPSLWVAWLLFAYQQLQLMYASHVLFLASAAVVIPVLVPLCSAWLARKLARADVDVVEATIAEVSAAASSDSQRASLPPADAATLTGTNHAGPHAAAMPTRAGAVAAANTSVDAGLLTRLPAATLVLICCGGGYATVSPTGWALTTNSLPGAVAMLSRVVELFRGYGALHLPVILHLQALFVLVASSAV